ncbi:type I restriction-modification system subunit M [Candidatus Nanohalovita haloferacivicina]|uniref:type I restriction-modification system subunit M n=1 Tax=Candidatus Nanohalovita haloferacivicina TaxID=2978046 RepID=UPI00325FA691|nr:Type I restriction enzyme, M subunit [Candidatus Nanohalobia archaeon BNXNv]
MAKEITEEELRDHLFKCADIIRDRVDPTDYKTYILPVVFYKAIDDTYQDRYEEALEETGDEELAKDQAFHDFQIPEDYRYEKALEQTENVDQFLNEAFDALESENPEKLENIFRVNFVNADGIDHDTLHRMLEHLNTKNMSLQRVKPDILGEAYMDLVRDFAESEGKDGGQFFTPQEMVQLMADVLNPENGDGTIKIYDPTVGSAGMLVEMAEHYREIGDPKKDLLLKGQEINPGIAPIARMNLFLHDLDGEITREDSLANPQFTENGKLEKFDYVLANPPFSADWQKDACQDDKYNRFDWGMARADRADYAFIQHMIKSLNEEGKMACVIPHGVLFRKHESKFREPMLENDMVEAVIGLPENLFQNNSIPSGILIVNKDKPEEREGQVQFIHAADENFYEELSNQNKLTEDGIKEIVEKYRNWETEERVSRVVDLEEIRENDYNLNIALYVDTTQPEENIEVAEELEKLKELQSEREEIENQMQEHMEALNYE